jgi:hypothetical protein
MDLKTKGQPGDAKNEMNEAKMRLLLGARHPLPYILLYRDSGSGNVILKAF